MPRNPSTGEYELPLPPVNANEKIKSEWANTTLDDIAVALTNSVASGGGTDIKFPVKFSRGTQLLPSITFAGTGLQDNGISLPPTTTAEPTDVLAVYMSVKGRSPMRWTANGVELNSAVSGDGPDVWKAINISQELPLGDQTIEGST